MSVFEMVVAIVLISTVAGLVSRWLKLQERQRAQAAVSDSASEALRAEVASLRERVATLERIVTDPAHELKRQIEALEMRRAA